MTYEKFPSPHNVCTQSDLLFKMARTQTYSLNPLPWRVLAPQTLRAWALHSHAGSILRTPTKPGFSGARMDGMMMSLTWRQSELMM